MSTDPEEFERNNDDDEVLMRRRKLHAHKEEISGLNLTAMMDMMTIILVFLIKRFGEAPENVAVNEDLQPPLSTSTSAIVPAVAVYISQSKIMVDAKPILDIENGRVVSEGSGSAFGPVGVALEARVRAIEALAGNGGTPFDGNVMIIADEDTTYEIISGVLYQAGLQRFETYRLIVRAGGK